MFFVRKKEHKNSKFKKTFQSAEQTLQPGCILPNANLQISKKYDWWTKYKRESLPDIQTALSHKQI